MTVEEAMKINQKWTAEQASNDLENLLLHGEKPADKVVAMAVKALRKQIPMKPEYEADGYDENGELVYDTAYCTICRHSFEYDINDWGCNFCSECGQALDWSDKE